MSYQTKTKFCLAILLTFALMLAFAALTAADAYGQTCTLRTQGYLGGCSNVNVLWFTQTNQSQIARFDLNTFAGRFTAPNTARSYSIPTGCGSGGQVVITEVHNDGSTCVAQYSGNLPHNRPCDQCGTNGGGNRMATRHAASFRGDLAPGTIGAAFGDQAFTTVTLTAPATPLPTQLGGVRFLIDDQEVPLFFVSPGQINFYVPESFAALSQQMIAQALSGINLERVRVTESGELAALYQARAIAPDGATTYGDILITANSPGIFTIESNGTGQSASVWLILSPNGLSRYRTNVDALPGERVFLLLYGSGITERVNYFGFTTGSATLRIVVNNQAREYPALFAGLANSTVFVGLNQLNFEIPQSELWSGLTGAQLTVSNFAGQSWQSNGFSIRGR